MDCYGKEGQLSAMQEAFEAMLADGIEPTSVTYNTLTNSFFRAGEVQKAEDTMDKCRQTIGLAFPSFLTLIWAYSRLGLAEKMEAAIREMQSQKLPIYRSTLVIYSFVVLATPLDLPMCFQANLDGPNLWLWPGWSGEQSSRGWKTVFEFPQ